MTYPLERIAQVERDLIVEENFAPLDRVLPLSGLAGAQFHACVARQKQDSMDVHAMMAWRSQEPGDLAARSGLLRRALESASVHFGGRVVVNLFLVTDSQDGLEAGSRALKEVEPGHFLEKIQFNKICVNVSTGALRFDGRVKPCPSLDWFEEHFISGGRHDAEAASRTLSQREEDESQSRHFLSSKAASRPWATYFLIGLNIFMFVATFAMAGSFLDHQGGAALSAQEQAAMSSAAQEQAMMVMGASQGSLVFGQNQLWRLVASLFIHADLIHLLMNMVALYSLGSLLERFAGSARMLFIYFFAGILGSSLSAWQHVDVASVGASGAILGMAGALLALRFRRPKGFPKLLAERLYGSLLWPVSFIFVLGLGLSLFHGQVNLDNWGHLGGLCGGFGLIYAFPVLLQPSISSGISSQNA